MRLGRVDYTMSVVVDLDNARMVELAKQEIVDNLSEVAFSDNDTITQQLEYTEDAALTEDDIDETVRELMSFDDDDTE